MMRAATIVLKRVGGVVACLCLVAVTASLHATDAAAAEVSVCAGESWNHQSPKATFAYGTTGGPTVTWTWGDYGETAGVREARFFLTDGSYSWFSGFKDSGIGETLPSGNHSYAVDWLESVAATVSVAWQTECGEMGSSETTFAMSPSAPLPLINGLPTMSNTSPKVGDTVTVIPGAYDCRGRGGCVSTAVFTDTGTSSRTITAADIGTMRFQMTQTAVNNIGAATPVTTEALVAGIEGIPVVEAAAISPNPAKIGQNLSLTGVKVQNNGATTSRSQEWQCAETATGPWTTVETGAGLLLTGGACKSGGYVRAVLHARNSAGVSDPFPTEVVPIASASAPPGLDGGNAQPIVSYTTEDGTVANGVETQGLFIGVRPNGLKWRVSKPKFLLAVAAPTTGTVRVRVQVSKADMKRYRLARPLVAAKKVKVPAANWTRSFDLAMGPVVQRIVRAAGKARVTIVATMKIDGRLTRVSLKATVTR